MKTTIYVFSGTGTSLAIAKKLGASLENTNVISIATIMQETENEKIKVDTERVGFVFPCYYGSIPKLVRDLIEKIDLSHVSYIFSVITSGGNPANSLKHLNNYLAAKGKKLNYGKTIKVSTNTIDAWYYMFSFVGGKKLQKATQKLNIKTMLMVAEISNGKNDIAKSSNIGYKISLFLAENKFVKDTRPWDKEFAADDKCIGCGICSKVCPVQNIEMKEDKPTFLHNCQRCMGCIQYCPQEAIRIQGKVLNKPRYFYPEITATDMISYRNSSKIKSKFNKMNIQDLE